MFGNILLRQDTKPILSNPRIRKTFGMKTTKVARLQIFLQKELQIFIFPI